MADEQIIVDIKVNSAEVVEADKNIDKLTISIADLSKGIASARDNNKQYKKTINDLNLQLAKGTISAESHKKQTKLLNDEIKKNNRSIAESSIELSKQKRERSANIKLIGSEKNAYEALSNKLGIVRKNAKNLGAQFGVNSKQFKTAAAGVQQLDSKLKLIDNELGLNVRSVAKYSDALKGVASQILGGLGITAAIGFLVNQFNKASERGDILIKSTNRLKGTFDLTTSEAQKLAIQINAIANNFEGVDSKNLEISLAAITGTFKDLSEQDALDLIQEGFQKGSNNSGEFLDILKEYPVQFKAAGIDAGTMFAIINQQVKEGIYSDKGVDTIKEGGLRLRENTKAVQEALKPLDDSIKAQIKQEIAAGNSFKAIQLVAEALKDTSLTAEQTQTIIADVFGGAGEDAGIEYIKTLADIETNLDNVANQTSINSETNLTLSKSYNAFILSVSNGSGVISSAFADIKEGFASFLDGITKINSESFGTKMKVMANGVLSVVNAISFGGLDKALKNVTGSEEAWRFDTEKQTGALKLQKNEIDKNEKSTRRLTTAEKEALKQTSITQAEKDKNAKKAEKAREKRESEEKKIIADNLKRTEAANTKLIELDNKRRLAATENAAELKNERIKIEEETLTKLLADETLLATEKEVLAQQSVQNIIKINEEFDEYKEDQRAKERKTADEDRILELEETEAAIEREVDADIEKAERKAEQEQNDRERITDHLNELGNIAESFAGPQTALFARLGQSIATAFEDGAITAESALKGLSVLSSAVFAAMSQGVSDSLSKNEKAREAELEMAGDNEEAKDAINIKFDKKSSELKRKQFKLDKAQSLIGVAIATALGAAQALPNLVLAGIVTAFGVAQGGFIAAQKAPTFATGTNDIVSIGGSHASGNDVDVFGVSGNQKQYFGKVEKGEAMPVIRKNAVNSYLVSKLNGKYSSGGRKFARGTNDITDNQGQNQNNGASAVEIASAIENITIVAKIEDITKQARKKVEIVDNSKV